ncbi:MULTISPECIES: M56 family metallopeptidase [Paenarthrobacter]|uniref:M56 family metallopeptidase n=1 Tax=Paenarthrobacter TaxID=1742992 RepID=UPI001408A3C9|nr:MULTISPECIES: M56 family metallopeptidase [Paenarthrobacter]MCX8455311.1 M56 family metallopeptidase [Paenarthrobacter ureafaciens]MCY0974038.1 M56 family metallopeptidase [Paenarthrobacter ureafaciens]QOT17451.1 M56 family metallopeptidase [Paenarthrobacter sp. YJN-5]UOD82801.1 M56 family metallopeptidase [Paenarthrobacter ureafaciens]WNZ02507.1 M56 family metallopeptidase [Paenarthrobacter ureafaciens]
MFWTSYFLAVLALILAWPVPVLLSRAHWPARSPFTAMVLWQAIALAGGLSMIGAMLVYGLEPIGNNLLAGLRSLAGMVLNDEPTTALGFWHLFALSAAALLTAHLVFTLLLTYYKIERQRRRHRELLALLASPSSDGSATMVINHDSPVAYCLPGGARSVTVLSDGLMAALEPDELRAVVIHEKAHLSQRHDLLLWAFAAWRQALPWFPTTKLAQTAVNSLIEMLADDVALRTESKSTLIKAIAIVSSGSTAPAPGSALNASALQPGSAILEGGRVSATGGADSPRTTASRVSRLLSPEPPLSKALRSLVLVASALLLAVPTALLIVPGLLG